MGKLKQVIKKGYPRAILDQQNPLGPIIRELQDVVDANDVSVSTSATNIATNTTSIATINARTYVRTFTVSFDTAEQGTLNLFFPTAVTITGARASVIKALANTDAGTIQLANNAGTNMTAGLLTIPLSSAVGTDVAVTPSANNVITAGQKVQVTTAKTTAGGKALLTLEFTYN